MPIQDVTYIALVEVKSGKQVFVLTNSESIDVVKTHISWWPTFVKLHAIKVLERPEEVEEWNAKLREDPDHRPASELYPDNAAKVMSETDGPDA